MSKVGFRGGGKISENEMGIGPLRTFLEDSLLLLTPGRQINS